MQRSYNTEKIRKSLQKHLVASKKIKKGDAFTEGNIIAKRTGGKGISPLYYRDVICRKADKNYTLDEIIDIQKK